MRVAVRTPRATVTYRVRFRKEIPRNRASRPARPNARVPRIARLLALAHRIDGMIRRGELKDWAEAARLVGVTRARMTQIANLLLLAPEIKEALLNRFLAENYSHRVTERDLRDLVSVIDWRGQVGCHHTPPNLARYHESTAIIRRLLQNPANVSDCT